MSRVAEQTLNYTIRFANALFADTAEFLKYLEEHSKDAKEYEVIKSLYDQVRVWFLPVSSFYNYFWYMYML